MAANYTLLEKITVGAAGASSVTFSSIPQTGYTDLVVKVSSRDTAESFFSAEFNGDTAANYSSRFIRGNGTNVATSTQTFLAGISTGSSSTANTFGNNEMYIPNYTSSSAKSASTDGVIENNATAGYNFLSANLWTGTAAITSIKLTPQASSTFKN